MDRSEKREKCERVYDLTKRLEGLLREAEATRSEINALVAELDAAEENPEIDPVASREKAAASIQ